MMLLAPVLFAALTAVDVAGRAVHLFPSAQPVALVFVRTDCPISNRYAPELLRLERLYSPQVVFYLVYPDAAETAEAIRRHMADYGYEWTALRDPGHALVKLAGATATPEAAVFTARGVLVYHGRIDNRYIDLGRAMAAPTRRDLEEALKAVRAGRPVEVGSTRPIGCSLRDVR
jgi:hypothetical protein